MTQTADYILSRELTIGDTIIPVRIVVATETYGKTGLGSQIAGTFDGGLQIALTSSCRGVEADLIPQILSNGCDVEPTDSPFFPGSLHKALEYGCASDQVIQIFRPEFLEASWCEHRLSVTAEARLSIERDYPTVIPRVDGTHLWFTRFPFEDARAATPYEQEYGQWIRGDARRAIAGLVILTADPSALVQNLTKAESSSETQLTQ